MKTRKILSIIAVVAMLVVCFAGCGNNEEVASDVTTISMWTNNSHSRTVMEELVKEFNEGQGKELGIYFDYQVKEGDSFAKSLQLALQTGQAPDLLNGGSLAERVENGNIVPLEDMPGGKELIEKFEGKFMMGTHTYKGKVYSLPAVVTTRGLVYNKDMFKAAGLVDENGEPTPPKTFKELREYAKILTDESKNQFGIIFPLKWSGWVGSDITDLMLGNAGHYGFDPTTGTYDYSAIIPVIETYQGIIADGSAYPGMQGIDNDTARAYFSNGLVGMKFAYSFDVAVFNEQFPAQCDWGVAPLPVVDPEAQQYKQFLSYAGTAQINKQAIEGKDPEKVMAVYKWLYSDEVRIRLYEAGVQIPEEWDLVKDVDTSKLLKGWAEFAQMTQISNKRNLMPNTDMEGLATFAERITDEVLSGKKTALQMIEEYNRDITAGTKKYYEIHTDESIDDYLDSSWNIKIEK